MKVFHVHLLSSFYIPNGTLGEGCRSPLIQGDYWAKQSKTEVGVPEGVKAPWS